MSIKLERSLVNLLKIFKIMLHTTAPQRDLNSNRKLCEKRDDDHTTSEYAIIIPPPLPSTKGLRHLITERKTETSSGPLVTSGECVKAPKPGAEPDPGRVFNPLTMGASTGETRPPPHTAQPPASRARGTHNLPPSRERRTRNFRTAGSTSLLCAGAVPLHKPPPRVPARCAGAVSLPALTPGAAWCAGAVSSRLDPGRGDLRRCDWRG